MASGLDRQSLPLARRHRYIQVDRVGGNAIHGAALSPKISADDPNVGTVVVRDLRDVRSFHLLVARRCHFERRRKVGPQLEAVHPARLVALGHLLVYDPAPRRHPLHIARADDAAIPHAVAVLHGSSQDVGNRLDPTMWMPWEAGKIILGNIIAEIIEQQKWIEVGGVAETECAAQMHTSTFTRRLGLDEPLDGSNGHIGLRYENHCQGTALIRADKSFKIHGLLQVADCGKSPRV